MPIIAGCYFVCGVLMTLTGYLFYIDILTAATQTTLWCIVFFFASAATSAGYLTVSEIFPDGDPRDGDSPVLLQRTSAASRIPYCSATQ